jgi:hypothetical protein
LTHGSYTRADAGYRAFGSGTAADDALAPDSNVITRPSGGQRGIVSRTFDVSVRGTSAALVPTVNSHVSQRFSFSFTVTCTNAIVEPSVAATNDAE